MSDHVVRPKPLLDLHTGIKLAVCFEATVLVTAVNECLWPLLAPGFR
ncbi:hypothetical protein [Streptomyces violascens]